MPLAIALVLAAVVRSTLHIYSIPSASMQPTLQPGDHIIVTPYFGDARPSRGDVVVFNSPIKPDELMVKRVIAEAGDLIATVNGRVTIGGHAIAEPYAANATLFIAPQIVPADSYFVLGDNRANSYDSRQWGTLPRALVAGRARMVLWSSRRSFFQAHPLIASRLYFAQRRSHYALASF
jgi:signal peptidase I